MAREYRVTTTYTNRVNAPTASAAERAVRSLHGPVRRGEGSRRIKATPAGGSKTRRKRTRRTF